MSVVPEVVSEPCICCCRYKNLDKLIHWVNKDGRINAFYSTPADYVDAKNSYDEAWPLKTDDFFPYADNPTSYWTGEPLFLVAFLHTHMSYV